MSLADSERVYVLIIKNVKIQLAVGIILQPSRHITQQWRRCYVKMTSFDVFTSKRHRFDVLTTLLLRHVFIEKYPPDSAESNDKQCDGEAMRRGDAEDVLTLSLRIHSQPAHEYEQGHSYEFCSHRTEDSVEAASWRRVIDERTLFAIRGGVYCIHAYWKWRNIIFIGRGHIH